jgi:hypothetical protein
MSIFSGPTKIAFGFGLGVAAAGIIREVLPAFRDLGRPLLKATVKSGLILARDSRFGLEHFREVLSDVAAEARTELAAVPEAARNQSFTEAKEQRAGVM